MESGCADGPAAGFVACRLEGSPITASNDQDVAATGLQLVKLLRVSPKLTTVVARDPSLLPIRSGVCESQTARNCSFCVAGSFLPPGFVKPATKKM